ncbi:hypothetical protein H9P43_001059 [Blastocladiella emersonii ATCC 22665]|nr:hypothetical protein H9P43_001059 [Blastocladiella emersonii ATCC 22665]
MSTTNQVPNGPIPGKLPNNAQFTGRDFEAMYEFRMYTVPKDPAGHEPTIRKSVRFASFSEQTARDRGYDWGTIPKGSFRMFPNSETQPCPSGFFCPTNTTQPSYCASGLYCPDPGTIYECPAGFYCPFGSSQPSKCHFFARCDSGTDKPTRFGIFGFVIGFAILASYVFYFKTKVDARRRASKELLLQQAHAGYGVVSGGDAAAERKSFDIEFDNISRMLPNGRYIMKDVSGRLRAGRSAAVMGGSGAGKSTLFSLITGKAPRTTGTVRIGKKEEELSHYSKLIGYVPQEDIMLRELTVSDILNHSAHMRLDANLARDVVSTKVAGIIDFLGLAHVSDSIIGNEAERGVSGGQRKRVNIGMEMVADPSVLLLDEPTSGLDSSTSLDVCAQLRKIAETQNMTIAAIIHSPSPATFAQFHDLILLVKGGRMGYCGPREEAPAYFASIGFKVPEGVSESDHYMDVLTGAVVSSFDPEFTIDMLPEYWAKHVRGEPITAAPESGAAGRKKQAAAHAKESKNPIVEFAMSIWESIHDFFTTTFEVVQEFVTWLFSIVACRHDPVRQTPNPFRIFALCAKRAGLQVYRSLYGFLGDQILHLGCGAFISIASQQMDYLGRQPEGVCQFTPIALRYFCSQPIDHIREVGIFMSLGVLFAGISVGTQTFGNERVVFWRDTAAGMPTLPYFLAKVIVDIPRVFVAAVMFSLSLILFWPYRSQFLSLFVIILFLYFAAFAMGYFLSTFVSRESVGLVGTGFALGWALVFGGVTPSLKDVYEPNSVYSGFSFMWNVSAPRYAIEALYLREVTARGFDDSSKPDFGAGFGYSITMEDKDLASIFYIACGWLVLAFLGLKLLNRDKQK